jgi:hypothetical protein
VLAEQHVRRLEVAVDDALAVGEADRVGGGQEARHQRQPLAQLPRLLDVLEQWPPRHQAHDVVGQAGRPAAGVVDRHDGRVLQARRDLHLALEAMQRGDIGVERLLDGDGAAEALVARGHHASHPATRDLDADLEARPRLVARGPRAPRCVHRVDRRRLRGVRHPGVAGRGGARARPVGGHGLQYSGGGRARSAADPTSRDTSRRPAASTSALVVERFRR